MLSATIRAIAPALVAAGGAEAAPGLPTALTTGIEADLGAVGLALLFALALTAAPAALAARARLRALGAENNRLAQEMLHDPLTGFANKRNLRGHLRQLFEEPPQDGRTVGVCVLDLDQFSNVLRVYGHAAGQQVLTIVAGILRETVSPDDFVARTCKDEFVVVVRDLCGPKELEALAGRIARRLAEPVWIGPYLRPIGGSIGVALRDAEADTPERLLENATVAHFEAQAVHGASYRMFSAQTRAAQETREAVIEEIRVGLRDDRFEPFFQPQVDAETGRLIGFEALARLRRADGEVAAPGHFLPLAEEVGLIDDIGAAILRKSLAAMSRWRQAGYDAPTLALNVSARELRAEGFVDKMKWDLEAADLAPERICIEVLESVLIDGEDDPAARNVCALAAAGFQIDLDDFGTGHASISNLKKFAADRLKIDRSFVTGVDADPAQQKLTAALLRLADSLGLAAIAEGVETDGERRKLIEMGCPLQQGFYHGRPMCADDALSWMVESATRLRAAGGAEARRTA